MAHSLFGDQSAASAFGRSALASTSWFSSAAATASYVNSYATVESEVGNMCANHTRAASTKAGAASDVADTSADMNLLSPAAGLLIRSHEYPFDAAESASALQKKAVDIVAELTADGKALPIATLRMNQIMSQLAVRGSVREVESVIEAFASTALPSSAQGADSSALVSTWFNTALQLFCAAVRRSSYAPSSSSSSARISSGRVPLAAAQVGTLLRMLARVDAVRSAATSTLTSSSSASAGPRRHISVTAATYEPLLVALAHAGQLDACWTTAQRLLSARESLTPPALTAVMAALYRHGA